MLSKATDAVICIPADAEMTFCIVVEAKVGALVGVPAETVLGLGVGPNRPHLS